MGLFSSKKKTVVNVTVQRVFDEENIPQAAKTGVLRYIMEQGDNISNYISEEALAGIGTKINTGYAWAKKNDYAAGIPTATVKSYIDAKSATLSAIAANVGQAITETYYYFGPINSIHFGLQYLFNTYNYDAQTNEIVGLSTTEGFKCYLKDMRATYTRESYDFIQETYDTGVLNQMGPSPQSGWTPSNPYTQLGTDQIGEYAPQPDYEVSDTAVDDYITITYEFVNAAGTIVTRGLTVSLESFTDDDYHQARYVRADGKTGFFTYMQGTGRYPGIDATYSLQYDDLGTYYPWLYARVKNKKVDEENFPELYADSVKWGKYIGVDFDNLLDGVHEDQDVSDVAQCILQVGCPPGSQNRFVIEYLFRHFTVLHENALSQMQMTDNLDEKFLAFSYSASQAQFIRDRLFSQTLKFSGITRKRIAGKIGKVGTYTGSYGYVPQNEQNMIAITPEGTKPINTSWAYQPAYIYRKQVLDSMYEEIAVYGLKISYDVSSKKGFGAGAGSDELLVPVDRAIAGTMSVIARQQMVCRAMHMLVNTVIEIKTPWYASGAFKVILLAIAVVVTIFSFGTAWASIVAAAAVGTWYVVLQLAILVLDAILIQAAIKLFVKAVGPEIGFIAAVAAIAYGGYVSFGANADAAFGTSLISVGNGLTKESSATYTRMAQDIADDMLEFQEWAEGQYDSLEEKRDELGLTNQSFAGLVGDDYINLVPDVYFGEAPNDYYSRTVHSGNIGAACYDMVTYYHTLQLQLPTLNDTQGLLYGDVSVSES